MYAEARAEEEDGPFVRVGQELSDAVPQPTEGLVAPAGPQDDNREVELQAEAPEDGVPVYLQAGIDR